MCIYKNDSEFCTCAGPISPNFTITRIATTTVTAQITDLTFLEFSYRFIVTLLQANGEEISIPGTLGPPLTRTTTIDNLYPFTTYKIEVQAQRSDREPWSYPASREVKTREEGTHAVNTI